MGRYDELKAVNYPALRQQEEILRSKQAEAQQCLSSPCAPTTQRDIPQQLEALEAVVTAAHSMFSHLESRLFTVCILDKPTDSNGCGIAPSSENVATRLAVLRNRVEELIQRGGTLIDRLQV